MRSHDCNKGPGPSGRKRSPPDHERLDGTGYPVGLRSSQVPLLAQIVGIAEVFGARTTARPYRLPLSRAVAFDMLATKRRKAGATGCWSMPSLRWSAMARPV